MVKIKKLFLFVGAKDIMLNSMETVDRMKKLVPYAKINILPVSGHSLIHLTDTILEQIQSVGFRNNCKLIKNNVISG